MKISNGKSSVKISTQGIKNLKLYLGRDDLKRAVDGGWWISAEKLVELLKIKQNIDKQIEELTK